MRVTAGTAVVWENYTDLRYVLVSTAPVYQLFLPLNFRFPIDFSELKNPLGSSQKFAVSL